MRLLVALLLPAPLLAQGVSVRVSPTIRIGGVTVSASSDGVKITTPGGRIGGRREPPRPRPAPAPASAARVMATADRYVGTRYTWGGETPSAGFDCSGFVQYVFERHGVPLPRTSRQMSRAGRKLPVRVRSLRRGDLIFFSQRGGRVDHVAIYAGNNRILHSSKSGGGVRYDDLSTTRGRWFAERMVGARRVIDDGRSLVDALDAALRLTAPLEPPDEAPAP